MNNVDAKEEEEEEEEELTGVYVFRVLIRPLMFGTKFLGGVSVQSFWGSAVAITSFIAWSPLSLSTHQYHLTLPNAGFQCVY